MGHTGMSFEVSSSREIADFVQAKGGFKTRAKRNPNKNMVKDRERNQGKRRNKK